MQKNALEIYALAVCFFAVACFVVVIGMTLWNIVKFSAPEFTIHSYEYEVHLNDENYRQWLIQSQNNNEDYTPPEGEALTKNREESWTSKLFAERRSALQDLVQNIIFLLFDILVFIVHWIMAGKLRRSH